jgi:hypothetical protein
MAIFSGQQMAGQTKGGLIMKKALLIICSFLLMLSISSVVIAGCNREKRIEDLLSQTEKHKDLEDTIHSNRDFLDAIGLILNEAEQKNMGKKDIENYYLERLKKAKWTRWTPYIITKKVDNGVYLVSIGAAAVTQPSSLYLFYDMSKVLIDRRDRGGTIDISTYKLREKKLEVIYSPEPGSTRPIRGTAYLEKEGDRWKVIKLIQKEK